MHFAYVHGYASRKKKNSACKINMVFTIIREGFLNFTQKTEEINTTYLNTNQHC